MHFRSFICALLCTAAIFVPVAAHATGHMPVEGGSVILAFGASYAGKTHRGLDISGGVGAAVDAPVAGEVVFAGNVPADGGGTCGAVTLELADGRRATVLPLQEVWVSAGARLASGDAVGSLAASGDDSSGQSHVHLSLRAGTAYLDPSVLLPGTSVSPEGASTAPATAGDAGGSSFGPAVTSASAGADVVQAHPSGVLADPVVPMGAQAADLTGSQVREVSSADVVTRVPVADPSAVTGVGSSQGAALAARRTHATPVGAGVPEQSRLDFWSEQVVGGSGRTASVPAPRALTVGAILSAALALCLPLVSGSAHRIRAAARMR